MGCDQSNSTCKNFCWHHKINGTIDQFEVFNNGNSTSRGESHSNRTDLSDNINHRDVTSTTILSKDVKKLFESNPKFAINLDTICRGNKTNIESDRSNNSNLQINMSEVKDGFETITQRREGKPFISLIKEFNFIYKLYRKCKEETYSKLMKDQIASEKQSEVFFNSLNNSINSVSNSLNSDFTVNSINSSNTKYQIKSTILNENKLKSKWKDYFNKLKNLIYIPIISITGQIRNSFIMKYDKYKLYSILSYTIGVPYSNNIAAYMINFIQNLPTNLSNSKLNEITKDENIYKTQIQIVNLFEIISSYKLKDLRLKFEFEELTDIKIIGISFLCLNKNDLFSKLPLDPKIINLLLNLSNQMKSSLALEEVTFLFKIKVEKNEINQLNCSDYVFQFSLINFSNILFEKFFEIVSQFSQNFRFAPDMNIINILKSFKDPINLFFKIHVEELENIQITEFGLKKIIQKVSIQNEKLIHSEIKMKFEVVNVMLDNKEHNFYNTYEYEL